MSQHYPPQPGWGAPPPQPPKKTNVGLIVGLSCAGLLGLFVVVALMGALLGDDSDSGGKGGTASSATTAPKTTEPATKTPSVATKPAPVKVTAKKTAFAKSILADGSDYTSILVTIVNNSDETISINPLYFTITDTAGTKHAHELGADKNQIDTTDLAPGENMSGVVTGKGRFTGKYVTYTDGLLGDPVRGSVS
jgi:hypothetical protein